jgi:hypothetical protein
VGQNLSSYFFIALLAVVRIATQTPKLMAHTDVIFFTFTSEVGETPRNDREY